MERLFDHANDEVWSTPRLEARYNELHLHTERVALSPDRLSQIQHEMACIAFEGIMRQAEANRRQQEITELEDRYND